MARTLEDVAFTVDDEGFDATFRYVSTFDDVNDPQFHKLRLNYVRAAELLEVYLVDNSHYDPDGYDDETTYGEDPLGGA